MTDLRALADCVCSGQVPDECVPGLVAETPGLREELERRSRAMSPVLTVEAGRGDSVLPTQTSFRPADFRLDCFPDQGQIMCAILSVCDGDYLPPGIYENVGSGIRLGAPNMPGIYRFYPAATAPADPVHFPGDSALAHRLGEEEARHRLKGLRLLSEFIRSLHPASFLRKLMRK